MGKPRTYKARCVVLRKTKLGEKDLVVTLLRDDGSLLRAVAKGARKPGGSMASKFELFSQVDGLFAVGRSLDVATDVRFANSSVHGVPGLEQSACASAVAELVAVIAQEDLEHPRLYDMTVAAFETIAASDPSHALVLCAAALLKVLASEGLRPRFDTCPACGRTVDLDSLGGRAVFSFEDGGVLCGSCPRPADAMAVDAGTLRWARALLYARFGDVAAWDVDEGAAFGVLQFCQQWIRVHAGRNLKSLDFVFTSGLF